MVSTVDQLRTWIRDALAAHGFSRADAAIASAPHGVFPPESYSAKDGTTLVLRGIVLGPTYAVHCLLEGCTPWRVDFRVASYVPTKPALHEKYAEYVHWRVEKSILNRNCARAQAMLDTLPEHVHDTIVAFLPAKDAARVGASCRVRIAHALQSD
ncbi:hypothetical protein ACHHYP_07742 [Achlya hypogyna]|uniref:F-box domain-containing protein n=1 Tax=Achlya hypogyna TaxID=1202772 RepID=A0A1V9ZLK3_ACHHY|nr:hypothetical protein ACHHYP_07742 [Achlya hypogyna]